MASDRHGPFSESVILLMEGALQGLRDMDPKSRPQQLTHVFLAMRLERSVPTIRRWRMQARQKERRNPTASHFLELYDRIADELGELISATPFKIAADPTNRQALAAVQYLLPKLNPAVYGDEQEVAPERDQTIADVPQEVFDELNEDELEQLAELQQAIEAAQAKCADVLKRVQKRLLDQSIADTAVH